MGLDYTIQLNQDDPDHLTWGQAELAAPLPQAVAQLVSVLRESFHIHDPDDENLPVTIRIDLAGAGYLWYKHTADDAVNIADEED